MIVEVHRAPEEALPDASRQLTAAEFEALAAGLRALRAIASPDGSRPG